MSKAATTLEGKALEAPKSPESSDESKDLVGFS